MEKETISTDKAGQFNNLSSLDQGMRRNSLVGISVNSVCIVVAKCSLGNNSALQRTAQNS